MNSNWKINFSFEWVNTQEKKSLQSENFEEKPKVVSLWEIKTEEKNLKVEEVFIEEKKWTIFKKEYDQNDERNQFIQYAYEKWWMDLVLLMERREPSYWFCMIDRDFHKNIVDDSRFRNDRKRQIDKCHELWKGWTKFYWPGRYIAKVGMKCSDYVKDRFYFQ